ncbi:hypothetical protein C8J57DRAFT_1129526 [Mycena rebaudengoi]|nr:hypothetical protein C8J57DRAFT_1129526 [Mycena rebaudengoi]
MSSDPSKASGQFHSMKGTAVEAMGNATGMTSMENSGKQEHAEGEAEVKGAQAKGMAEGMIDRAMGMKDSIVGSVMGNQAQQASGNVQKAAGEAKTEMNKP